MGTMTEVLKTTEHVMENRAEGAKNLQILLLYSKFLNNWRPIW